MYLYFLFMCNIIFVDCFIINERYNNFVGTHNFKQLSNSIDFNNKINKLYSKKDNNDDDLETKDESSQKQIESHTPQEDDNELVDFFVNPNETDESSKIKIKISRRLYKIINGILAYRAKHGNYIIENDFVFSKNEKGYLSRYKLGKNLLILLRLIFYEKRNIKLYNKLRNRLKKTNTDFLDSDLIEAPKLLWMLGFPAKLFFEQSKKYTQIYFKEQVISNKIKKMDKHKVFGSIKEDSEDESSSGLTERLKKGKKAILENMFAQKKKMKDEMMFSNPQQFPEPTNKAEPTPDLIRKIVKQILNKNTATCPLIKRDTRFETEGGYHYAFFHWSFEQVLQALVMFNEMYFDYNKQLLIESERSGKEFHPITFNILKRSYRIPETDYWPEEFHGMPLGLFVNRLRNGDIDAKEHWLRRPILDHIGFNWGDGLNYLTFTWDKLELGLMWYINFRGYPVDSIPPNLIIPKTTLVAKFGKPEELQGLKLGRLFFMAMDQIQVLNKHYPKRFQLLCDLELDLLNRRQINLGYRPVPHSKLNKVDGNLLVSSDKRYLFDEFNEPPDDYKDNVLNIMKID